MTDRQADPHQDKERQGQDGTTGAPGTGVPAAHHGVGFFAVCLAYCAIIVDGSVLNVAVPTIRDHLGSSMAGAQWVLDAYTLPLAALLLTAGTMGDRVGLRRMLLSGITVFTLASAACASAPDVTLLIAARAAQGVGAAALLPATLALVPYLFSRKADRDRATVAWVAAGSIAVAAGPLIGGLLIDTLGWRSIFLINLPVGLVSGWLARRHVPETPRRRVPLDHAGQVAAAAALGLLTAGLILGGAAGWTAPATLGALAAGIAASAGFWLAERNGRHPMLPLSFFTDRLRTTAVVSAGLMGFVFYGTLFAMSLYFQQERGGSPGAAGIALLPLTASSTIGPLAAYRPLSRRYGHAVLLPAGFACSLAGIATLAVIGPRTPYVVALVGLLLTGGASTIAFSALTTLLMSSTPPGQAGLSAGLQNTTRQSGALIAVSVIGSVLVLPGGTLAAAFAILGVADLTGVVLGVLAVRRTAPPADNPQVAVPQLRGWTTRTHRRLRSSSILTGR
jgi:MFS transporter, DHA2 family, methylenomycin A resistance protein